VKNIILLLMLIVTSNFAKNILILNSYHSTFAWTKNQNDNIIKQLNKNAKHKIVFYIEYMDTKRFKPTTKRLKSIKTYLSDKYKNINIDIVVTTDDNALNFIRTNKKDLFANAKVFFSGVNNLRLSKKLDKKIYSGVFEKMSPIENVNIAKNIMDDIKTIYFIGDDSKTCNILARIFKNELIQKDIQYKYISNKYIDKVKQELSNSEKNSVGVFIMPASFRDKNNNFIPMKIAMQEMVQWHT